jgi:hypothetical protein
MRKMDGADVRLEPATSSVTGKHSLFRIWLNYKQNRRLQHISD